MTTTQCFWVERADGEEWGLRRYVLSDDCPGNVGYGYHNAENILGRSTSAPRDVDHNDPRWPQKCDHCDYRFAPEDSWQVRTERVWCRLDTGEKWTDRRLPPGAMFDGAWYPWKGSDGLSLVVVLPPATVDSRGNWWNVDGPSRNNGVPGPGWTRTGDPRAIPPTVSVSPSIAVSGYHGFLQDGILGPDLDAASRGR